MWNGTDNDFAVYRYLSNGTLDTTFSGDGKIVVLGYTGDASNNNNNFAVARLNAGGSLDTTFSGDGRQITNFGADEYVNGIALQPNGKIVAVGLKYSPTSLFESFAIARYKMDGSLDTTFNGSGRKVLGIISGETSWASDVIVESDGKIVVLGTTDIGGGVFDFALVRLNPGGSFDTTFSGDGKVTVDFGGPESGLALVLQPSDGRYVMGGETNDGTQFDFALARALP